MTREELLSLLELEWLAIHELLRTKGNDYSRDDDALSNFKVNAQRFGIAPAQTWGVYAFKHLDAIATYVRDGRVESEPIELRIRDAILYLFLLRALVEEEVNP